jgi:fucose 4-O-acetylase-like acetyltransferase
LSRDSSIDALRGLAIILVVLGHAIPDAAAVSHGGPGLVDLGGFWVPMATASSLFLSFIYAFHMPLFAFVSGLVMWPPRGRSIPAGVVARVRSLLVPYLAWFVILFFVDRWVSGASQQFGPALTGSVLGRGGLWYLYALFISATAVICLAELPGSRWFLAASALGVVLWPKGHLPDVLQLVGLLWIYPFVVLGYMTGPLKDWVMDHRPLTITAGLVGFVPLFYLRQPFHVVSAQPITQLAAAVGRIAVAMHAAGIRGGYLLSLLFFPLVSVPAYGCAVAAIFTLFALYLGRVGRLIDLQAWFGRKSLGIYAVHGPLLWWLVSRGVKNVLVLTVLALGVSALATAVLERIPILDSVLLGRRTAWSADTGSPEVPTAAADDSGVW